MTSPRRLVMVWGALVALPLLGLWLLLAAPRLDVHWEHHPAHFWLVLAVAVVNSALGLLMSEAARRRRDARLFLISLALLASAGFFALHALATPGVLVAGKNAGFVIATPIGLLVAAVFAGLSALDWPPRRARALLRAQAIVRGALVALLVAWAVVSLLEVGRLSRPLAEDVASGPLIGLATVGVLLYALSAARYFQLYARRPAPMLLGVVTAFALLAEAMIAVAFGRSWHATWWEWHVLLLLAFGLVAWSARAEWRREGTTAEIFGDLYLDETRGHREELSVLFADLQGFTSYSERTRDEEVKEMLDAYFAAAAPIVAEHRGRIDKTIGDAIMVVFRDESHAARAVHAALAFQRATGTIADGHPDWPRFRAGVNTGEAVVGLVDARGGRAYTVTGDAVNVAARLEAKARAGEVVVGSDTFSRLPDGTDAEALGELEVKGRERRVEAFVVRALPDASAT